MIKRVIVEEESTELVDFPDAQYQQADVVSVARRIEPLVLRSLDAIHLATAVLIDADLVVTYDDRLADACRRNSLAVASPGRD